MAARAGGGRPVDDDNAMPARRRRIGAEPEQQFFYRESPSLTAGGAQSSAGQWNGSDNNEKLLATQQQQELVPPTMSSRDRTQEFGNAIRIMQDRTVSRAAVLKNPRQARHLQSYSNFMMIAKNIGKNIASTYAKLEKLAFRKELCFLFLC